ncbi:MAG: hypothetical protein WD425_15795 [Nitrospirales bacterium]
MREALITATEAAIRAVGAARFFETERGFHGRFYCALQAELDRAGLIANGAILEMEYQKSERHDMVQRPDIVFHIPAEHSGAGARAYNFAVWALKNFGPRPLRLALTLKSSIKCLTNLGINMGSS